MSQPILHTTRTLILSVCCEEREIECDVFYTFTPEEARTWDNPGTPAQAQAEVRNVIVKGQGDITALLGPDIVKVIEDDIANDCQTAINTRRALWPRSPSAW